MPGREESAEPGRDRVAARWASMVADVADHVRRHVDADLSLESLAAVAHVSPFHFHRLFTAVAGETPAAFVRRSRLERAAKLMLARPDRRLTDIAQDVGLSSSSELSRSFRRAHGFRPSSLEPGRRRWAGVAPVPPPVDRGSETSLRALPARRLAVVRARGVVGRDDLSAHYDRLVRWAGASGLADDWQLVGMSWDDHETTPLERVHYEFGAVVADGVPVAPLLERRLPAVAVVAVRCDGPLVDVADAWDYLYRAWFPATGRWPANLPAMTAFRRRPDQSGWSTWEVDCQIALAHGPGSGAPA